MSQVYSDEMAAAVAAVRAAAKVCRAVQEKLVTAQSVQKKDKSPVTVADYASQAVVCAALAERFPNDPIVAEEGTGELRLEEQRAVRAAIVERLSELHGRAIDEAAALDWIDRGGHATGNEPRFWTLDPIDGTKGFLRHEQYAVALALIEHGRVVLGVLACPNLKVDDVAGVLMVAGHGQDARRLALWDEEMTYAAGRAVCVADVASPAQARFCESVESGHSDQEASAKIAAALGIVAPPLRMDSQAKYAAVAAGLAHIYLRLPTRADYREKIWDHAAGMMVVQAAGGRVTDIDGKPLEFTHGRELAGNRGVVATSGPIHDAVLAAIQR